MICTESVCDSEWLGVEPATPDHKFNTYAVIEINPAVLRILTKTTKCQQQGSHKPSVMPSCKQAI